MNLWKKALGTVAISLGFLAGPGCQNNSKYHFEGEIKGKQVKYHENILGEDFLEVGEGEGNDTIYGLADDFKVVRIKTKNRFGRKIDSRKALAYNDYGQNERFGHAQAEVYGWLKEIQKEKNFEEGFPIILYNRGESIVYPIYFYKERSK